MVDWNSGVLRYCVTLNEGGKGGGGVMILRGGGV